MLLAPLTSFTTRVFYNTQPLADQKKLFLIINRLVLGGNTADAVSLAHHLSSKYSITIVYGEKESDEIEMSFFLQQYPEITFLKIPSLHRAIHLWYDVIAYRQLVKLLRKHKPDIVHTHGFKSGWLGRRAAYKTGMPVIIHTYHGHIFHSYYNRFVSSFIVRIERWLASFSTRLIAISPQQAHEISIVFRIAKPNKIATLFLGVEKENYVAIDKGIREQYSLPAEAIIISIIGRLVPIKNHALFVEIAEQIIKQEDNVYFFLIGDGNQKQHIQQQLTQRRLAWQERSAASNNARVFFTSWITHIASALQDTDIVLLTSLNEGTPVSLIEAQLFEKPVVATDVGGVQDTMIDGETGFLIPHFDVQEAVHKLQLLIKDKALRSNMGKKGEQFATERFSKQKEVAAIDTLYTDCLLSKNIR